MSEQKSSRHTENPEISPLKVSAVVGKTLEIEGDLSGQEDVTIEGVFRGKIELNQNDVHIDTDAEVQAEIYARDVMVKGHLKGNIFAAGKVHIAETGKMSGDIVASRISIGDGAQFKGRVQIKTGQSPSP